MPRKKITRTNISINIDPNYGSFLVSKMINYIMLDGKKSLAQRIMYETLEICKKHFIESHLEKFPEKKNREMTDSEVKKIVLSELYLSIENITVVYTTKKIRVGGANYQVPKEIESEKGAQNAMKMIVSVSRDTRSKNTSAESMAEVILSAHKNQSGPIIKERDSIISNLNSKRVYMGLGSAQKRK
jgi:small subunit ribosomal protein S7